MRELRGADLFFREGGLVERFGGVTAGREARRGSTRVRFFAPFARLAIRHPPPNLPNPGETSGSNANRS